MTDMTDQQAVPVAQIDRDAAARLFGKTDWSATQFRTGKRDKDDKVQAFARHRLASVSYASAEIPATMKPWMGGDSAPDDWDGGPVKARNGKTVYTPAYWQHRPEAEWSGQWDIVSYTPARVLNLPEPVPATNQAGEVERQAFRPMNTWDCRDEIVMLLVDYREDGDHALDDADIAITVGHNNDHNVGEGEGQGWQFAGWCWTHDHYVEGKGKAVGWMPLPHILARAYAAFDGEPAALATQPATSQEGEA